MSCLSECVALREYGYGLAHRAAMKRSYRVERRTSRVRIPVWPTWGLSTSISGGEVAKGAMLETELFALLEQTADVAYTVDRKSTRLNSSHLVISYAVFCLKKKKKKAY